MSELFQKIMKGDIEIPGMPDVAMKIMLTLEDEYCSVEKLEKVISADLAITSIILKIANSPAYQTGKPVLTVSDAMLTVGIQNLLPLVCIAAFANEHSGHRVDRDILQHLMLVSAAASMLSEYVSVITVKKEVAALAGLFHDVGKMVLHANFRETYINIKHRALKEKRPFCELESEVIGFGHAMVGSMVAKKWNLPRVYSAAIRNHHEAMVKRSGLAEEDVICYLIRVADRMALAPERSPFISAEHHLPELLSALGIEPANYQVFAERFKKIDKVNI